MELPVVAGHSARPHLEERSEDLEVLLVWDLADQDSFQASHKSWAVEVVKDQST